MTTSNEELKLRTQWDREGVPLEVQDQIVGGITGERAAAPAAVQAAPMRHPADDTQ